MEIILNILELLNFFSNIVLWYINLKKRIMVFNVYSIMNIIW